MIFFRPQLSSSPARPLSFSLLPACLSELCTAQNVLFYSNFAEFQQLNLNSRVVVVAAAGMHLFIIFCCVSSSGV